jgi:hypothetical protein
MPVIISLPSPVVIAPCTSWRCRSHQAGGTSYYVITITSINKRASCDPSTRSDYVSGASASYYVVTITSSKSGGKHKAYPGKTSPSKYIVALSSLNSGTVA